MNRLLRLLADNRGVRGARRYEIANADTDEATVYLYDVIVSSSVEAEWYGGVAAEAFVRDFAALEASRIHLRINSPGGDVFAARAMEQAIRAHPATTIAHIDGYAASAASFVALAAKEVEIADGGFIMIHKSWAFAMGNADDLVATAALLEQVDSTLVATYARRTGLPEDEIRELLAAETWFNAQAAVEKGFADRIADPESRASARLDWSLEAYGAAAPRREPPPAEPVPDRAARARRLHHIERIAA